MTTGDRVAAQRRAMDLTQAQLASMADMTQTAIWQIEHGHRAPGAPTLCKLADALHVSADWLLCRSANAGTSAITDGLTADELRTLTMIADAFRAARSQ